MQRRHATVAARVVAAVLLFVVGILVGQQFCTEEPQPPPEPDCPPSPPRVVERCPPDDEPDDIEIDETVEPAERTAEETSRPLPEEPPPADPEQRRQLLAWARGQSTDLDDCPRDRGDTHRFGITLQLDDDGAVDDVTIASDESVDGELRQCLRRQLAKWTVPEELRPTDRQVFFGLTL